VVPDDKKTNTHNPIQINDKQFEVIMIIDGADTTIMSNGRASNVRTTYQIAHWPKESRNSKPKSPPTGKRTSRGELQKV
jgi:hypothetical protein